MRSPEVLDGWVEEEWSAFGIRDPNLGYEYVGIPGVGALPACPGPTCHTTKPARYGRRRCDSHCAGWRLNPGREVGGIGCTLFRTHASLACLLADPPSGSGQSFWCVVVG